mmetsp:Transcript_16005/g.47414  ORF Transcript_16005/g.47414 Transcript_16005/m.47414 type:complete len:162 (-) Transcript_16005:295-780(-)
MARESAISKKSRSGSSRAAARERPASPGTPPGHTSAIVRFGPPSSGPRSATCKVYVPPHNLDTSVVRSFVCPAPGCVACYATAAGLYQHKRTYHPETIASRGSPRGAISYDGDRRFECPACDKCYNSSQGLYQHKRAKHPWLINERERGYTRLSGSPSICE